MLRGQVPRRIQIYIASLSAGRIEMGGGKMVGRGRFWRSGSVSEAPPMSIRTPQPIPEGPAEGPALGEGLLGPYAHRRGLRDRTGPPKPASTPHFATTHFAAPGSVATLTPSVT